MNSYEVVKSYYSQKRDFELLRIFCYSQESILEVLTATSILMQEKKIYKSKKWLDFRVCQNFDSKPVYSAYTRPCYKCLNAFIH